MPTIARRFKPGLFFVGLAVALGGALLLFLEFGTEVFTNEGGGLGRGWLKLALLGVVLLLGGLAALWQGLHGRGCSVCKVELAEGARKLDPSAWAPLQQLLAQASGGAPHALLQVAQAPEAQHFHAGAQYAVFAYACCPRCRQVGLASASLERVGPNGSETQQRAAEVQVQGPLAAQLAGLVQFA